MNVAFNVARRSRCVKAQVGCVLVSPRNTAAAVSYNGPPANLQVANTSRLGMAVTNCDSWCPHAIDPSGGRRDYMDCVSSHAEANGLMQADKTTLLGGTAYVTTMPCFFCAKMLCNSGITKVVFGDTGQYRETPLTFEMFSQCGIEVVRWKT